MVGLLISILFFAAGTGKNTELDSYLNKKLSDYKKYEYEVISLPSYVNSINDEKISISSDRDFRINYGYAYVPIDIKLSDENISQSVVTVKVNLFAEVYVANRKIRRGDIVSSADFTIKEEDVTHLRNDRVRDASKINNHQASINIAEGAILQKNMIETLPDLRAGDKVFAYTTVGSVMVSFPVTVRESGRIGEKVRVVRDDRLTFKALIVASDKVKIIE
jgi:flagella basal body P-ring formation protein FlgA